MGEFAAIAFEAQHMRSRFGSFTFAAKDRLSASGFAPAWDWLPFVGIRHFHIDEHMRARAHCTPLLVFASSDARDDFENAIVQPARNAHEGSNTARTSGPSSSSEQEKPTVNKKIAVMLFFVAALASLNASATTYGNSLTAPNGLYQYDMLVSANGRYRALLQGDGNFVVSRIADNALVWANYAYGTTWIGVQTDGNFVAYNTNTTPATAIWNSQTGGQGGTGACTAHLNLEDDGSLKLFGYGCAQIWSSPSDSTCPGGAQMTLYPICLTYSYPYYTLPIPACSYSDALQYAYQHYYPYYYAGACR